MSDTINDMVAVYGISEEEAVEIVTNLTHWLGGDTKWGTLKLWE